MYIKSETTEISHLFWENPENVSTRNNDVA